MISLEEHILRMRELSESLLNADRPVFFAAQSALSEMTDRIFVQGKDISGGQFIYDYRTPLYVNPDNSPKKFKPKGKPKEGGKRKKDTKKDRKTRWFPSYGAFREAIGREYYFVNWTLFGNLKSEVENKTTEGLTPRKIGDGEYEVKVSSDENTGKLRGLMAKYPHTFEFSDSEKKTYFKIFDIEILRRIREATG